MEEGREREEEESACESEREREVWRWNKMRIKFPKDKILKEVSRAEEK